jgi:hypothetical protein
LESKILEKTKKSKGIKTMIIDYYFETRRSRVAWSNAQDSRFKKGEIPSFRGSWVRIPPPPPNHRFASHTDAIDVDTEKGGCLQTYNELAK